MYVKLADLIDNLYQLCNKDCTKCSYCSEKHYRCDLVDFILKIRESAKELIENADL